MDGKLDYVVANSASGQGGTVILNKVTNYNNAPKAPGSIKVEFKGNDVFVTWTPGKDKETPQDLLTYNLRIGTREGGPDSVLSVPSSPYCVKQGNVGHSYSWKIKNLSKIAMYIFSVQTVDSGLRGSEWLTKEYYHNQAPDADDFNISYNYLNLNKSYPGYPEPGTRISIHLSKASKVTIEIINLEGSVVKTIIKDQLLPAGYDSDEYKEWACKNDSENKIAPGLYWVVVKTEDWIKKKRILIMW